MSYTFTLSGSQSVLRTNFYPPINLGENDEYVLALVNFETYNSMPNVNSSNNKFYYKKVNDILNQTIEIPEGAYEVESINEYIKKAVGDPTVDSKIIKLTQKVKLKNSKLKLPETFVTIKSNNNTLKCEILSSLEIDFTPKDSIGPLLGFKHKKLEPNKLHISDYIVDVNKINMIGVECNIAAGSYRNNKSVHIIHEFFPNVPPGFKIVENPANVIYLPINTKQIGELTVEIVDQNGNLINLRKETVTVRLHLKKLRS